jgi:hypothetical protein
MLKREVIEDLLHPPHGGPSGARILEAQQQFISALLKDTGCSNLEDLTSHLSHRYLSLLKHLLKMFCNIPHSLIDEHPVYVIPSALFQAQSLISKGTPCIVLHQGLFTLLSFAIEIDALLYASSKLRMPERRQKELQYKLLLPYTLLFYRYLVEPFQLPPLRHGFTPELTRKAISFLTAAELFVFLHELSHIKLGHLIYRSSERLDVPNQFLLGEEHNVWKEQELKADTYAINLIDVQDRKFLIQGGIMFLSKLSLYESYMGVTRDAHPHAINRLNHLVKSSSEWIDEDDRKLTEEETQFLLREHNNLMDMPAEVKRDNIYNQDIWTNIAKLIEAANQITPFP